MALPVAALAAVALAGCKEQEYKPIENSVYFAAAPSDVTAAMPFGAESMNVDIVVRLADYADHDVTATLDVDMDGDMLAAYNTAHGKNYIAIPQAHLSVSGNDVRVLPSGEVEVTILAGEISKAARVTVENFDMNMEAEYGIVASLLSTGDGKIKVSSRLNDVLCVVTAPPPAPRPIAFPLQVPVVYGVNDQSLCAHKENDWGLLLKSFTIEWWGNMQNYSKNNRAVFSNDAIGDAGGGTEFYLRFGDANYPYTYIQIKAWGGQIEGPRDLVARKWYHWAVVWDGDAKVMTIYRDGEEYAVKKDLPDPPRADGMIIFQKLAMASSGATYFNTNGSFNNVRFWRGVRTQADIQANMNFTVWGGDKNMIAYWPMNEFKAGTTDTMEDITGNGNDMVAGAGIFRKWASVGNFTDLMDY